MADRISIDLGEYGEILVEPVGPMPAAPATEDGALVKAGLRETLQETRKEIKVKAQELPKLPLTGLGKLFMAALPDPLTNDRWQLDEVAVEFEVGLEAQVGAQAGAKLVICSNGSFKCAYTWKRIPETVVTQPKL